MNTSLRHIDDNSREMLERAKSAIHSVEPDAEIFLFGSRARGDSNEDSDWDLLVLLSGESDYKRNRTVIHQIFDIELSYRQIFNTIIYLKDYWMKDRVFRATPFNKNVRKDKIQL